MFLTRLDLELFFDLNLNSFMLIFIKISYFQATQEPLFNQLSEIMGNENDLTAIQITIER